MTLPGLMAVELILGMKVSETEECGFGRGP
jgi:hypothetical protein